MKRLIKMPYYAVARGRKTGIFNNWESCKAQVLGYSNAVFKKFDDISDAQGFLVSRGCANGTGHSQQVQKSSFIGGTVKSISPTSFSPFSLPVQNVYCDGASRNNGKVNALAGWGVFFGDEDSRNSYSVLPGKMQTNQRAELFAIKYATDMILGELEDVQTPDEVDRLYVIKTDSKYSINALTKWRFTWERNGWQNSIGQPVANTDLIRHIIQNIESINEIYASLNGSRLKIEYVPGHSGDYGNDMADWLANLGVDQHFR